MDTKTFPIQVERGADPHPLRVPWDVAELAYSVYAGKYGTSQSLERLAQRGGFAPSEMDIFVPDWRTRCDLVQWLRGQVKRLRKTLAEIADLPTHCGGGCGEGCCGCIQRAIGRADQALEEKCERDATPA